jgi:hypothetical protein
MKFPIVKSCVLLVVLMLVGAAVASSLHFVATAIADDATKKSEGSLNEKLVGTWVLVGKPGQVTEPPKSGGMLKFITGKHWCITQADPKTGKVTLHHGGTYTLDGDKYVETVEYANESTISMLRQKLTFTVKVDGDTYTQTGVGNPYTQVWKRLN